MGEQNFIDQIDCERFFDGIEDLIEFPSVTSVDYADIWTQNSHELQVSVPPIFSDHNCAAALSPDLSLPYEDIVQTEWLSSFVEDSFCGGGMAINTETIPVDDEPLVVANYQFRMPSPVSVLESSSSSSSSGSCGKMIPMDQTHHGPQRARSKRPRPPAFNPRAAIELLSPSNLIPVPVSSVESNWRPVKVPKSNNGGPDQKKRKKTEAQINPEDQNQTGQGVRKCMHCEITKTPQWRAGPMGPKTLCNACGVRYKSGRLFPEYRPAASPTFIPTVHSNSHKKVVEMRTKYMPNDVKPEPELIPNMNPPPVDYN